MDGMQKWRPGFCFFGLQAVGRWRVLLLAKGAVTRSITAALLPLRSSSGLVQKVFVEPQWLSSYEQLLFSSLLRGCTRANCLG